MLNTPRARGFALPEMLLLIALFSLLATIAWPIFGAARQAARRTTFAAHLRQIGRAYDMYLADYGSYPEPPALAHTLAQGDRRILFCPDDTTIAPRRAASSYLFRRCVPPNLLPITRMTELDPNTVLAICDHHLDQRRIVGKDDETRLTPPRYPYHLVLRAGGTVEHILVSRRHKRTLPSGRSYTYLYPGEPGYDPPKR